MEQVIRAMLFPATSDESGGFQARVWQDIMKSLSQANIQVERDLVAVLTRAANRLAYRPEVEEKLGADIAARIFNRVARRECPESFDSGVLTRRRADGVWESHARLLGAYAYVSGALAKVGANVPVECPICFESVADYYLGQCGHFVCSGCRPRIQNCPLCRASGRVWRRGSAVTFFQGRP